MWKWLILHYQECLLTGMRDFLFEMEGEKNHRIGADRSSPAVYSFYNSTRLFAWHGDLPFKYQIITVWGVPSTPPPFNHGLWRHSTTSTKLPRNVRAPPSLPCAGRRSSAAAPLWPCAVGSTPPTDASSCEPRGAGAWLPSAAASWPLPWPEKKPWVFMPRICREMQMSALFQDGVIYIGVIDCNFTTAINTTQYIQDED